MDRMRQRIVAALLIGTCLSFPSARAEAAVTNQEWQWMDAAGSADERGDDEAAAAARTPLVESLRTHNYDACGIQAQRLGENLIALERYDEAVDAFQTEVECWSKLPERADWTLRDQRRIQQYTAEIRTFVARPTAAEPATELAKLEPAFGTILGGTIDRDPFVMNDLSRTGEAYGKVYGMVLAYASWNDSVAAPSLREAQEHGATLQIGWEPDKGLEAVQDDEYVRSFARTLREFGQPVFLRYASEMNGAWTPWYGNPTLYKDKFRLIARVMREEAPNVAMVWAPGFIGDDDFRAYYPGDEWVDWVGVNLYHDYYFQNDPAVSTPVNEDIFYAGPRSNPLDKLKEIYSEYAARKPIMVAETGFRWAADEQHPHQGWATEALQEFYGYIPLLYPRVKAIGYFNVGGVVGGKDVSYYMLSRSPQLTAAFRQATSGDWYLGARSPAPSSFWRPLEQASLTGPTHVAAYVHLPGGVSRVEYLLDGRVMATAWQLPWEADLSLGGLTGNRTLTVRAYDQKGRLGHERSYSFDASAVRVQVDGRYLDFDQPPAEVNGHVLVPARALLEALGARVSWNAATQTITAEREESQLQLTVGSLTPVQDGRPLPAMEAPAQLTGGRTLVPARVAELYGMTVTWDSAHRTVVIQNPAR